MTKSPQIKFAMTSVAATYYILISRISRNFQVYHLSSYLDWLSGKLKFSAKTFHIFLTFQVTSKCRRSQRMARQLLRIQTESCPMCAKITRRAALKNKNKTNLSTIRRRKIFSLFFVWLFERRQIHIITIIITTTTILPIPHFFIFFSYRS